MNKIIKNSGKILISGLLIFSLVGCGKVPVLKNGEDAIVTSNNKNISVTEFYEKIKDKLPRISNRKQTITENNLKEYRPRRKEVKKKDPKLSNAGRPLGKKDDTKEMT